MFGGAVIHKGMRSKGRLSGVGGTWTGVGDGQPNRRKGIQGRWKKWAEALWRRNLHVGSLCCSGSTGSLLVPWTKCVCPPSSLGICQFLGDTAGQQDLSPRLPTLSLRLLRSPDFSPGTSLPSLDKVFSLHIICLGIATRAYAFRKTITTTT